MDRWSMLSKDPFDPVFTSAVDKTIQEVVAKLNKFRENMVIDLMLRGIRLSEMQWVTDPNRKEWLCAPGYKIPAPEYRMEGTMIHITGWELPPQGGEEGAE